MVRRRPRATRSDTLFSYTPVFRSDAWRDPSNGVHEMTGTYPVTGEERVYRQAVRKDTQYWFFLAYDIAEERESQQRLNRALIGSVGLFTLLSALIGRWSAARVMSPASELGRRLQASGDSMQPDQLAGHFPEDEVGQRTEEQTAELQYFTRTSYAVYSLNT